MDENNREELLAEKIAEKKKKKAKIIAGTITVIIFGFWLVYFITSTRKEYTDKKPFALLDNLKQNTMKPINEMKGFFTEIYNNITKGIASSTEATTTTDLNNTNNTSTTTLR